jgi:GxxExxY protein
MENDEWRVKVVDSNENIVKAHAQMVFDKLGPGHQETVYSSALQRQLWLHQVDNQSETVVPIKYEGAIVGYVRTDITILPDGPILELKAISNRPCDIQLQQLVNYLKLTQTQEGYLINFPQPSRAMSKSTRAEVDVVHILNKQQVDLPG